MTDNTLYQYNSEVRWSDCDANQHMRHSAYADLFAHARIHFFNSIGLGHKKLQRDRYGPILFQETTSYHQESLINDQLTITIDAVEKTQYSKSVKILQSIYNQGTLSASHKCTIAWMDLDQRKVIEIPEAIYSITGEQRV